jgi:hypothetical protein
MTTLVWLFFALACFSSSLITFRITRWYYRRKIKINGKRIALGHS